MSTLGQSESGPIAAEGADPRDAPDRGGGIPPKLGMAIGGAALVAGALAVFQPLLGLAVAFVVLVVVLLQATPIPAIGRVLLGMTALAAVAGPSLAAPSVPWLFGFRVLIVLLGMGLVAYLLMGGRLALPETLPRPAGLLGIWLVWSVLSIGWSQDVIAAARWSLFLAMMSLLAIGIAFICRDPDRARRLLWALGGAFVIACLVALAELATGLHLPSARGEAGQNVIFGAASFFGNENNFAIFLALAMPWFLALPVIYRDARLRLLGTAGALVAGGFLVLTGSKTALLAFGVVVLVLLVVVGGDRQQRGRLVAAGGVAAVAILLVVPSVLGMGLIPLDERTVTKFNFGILAQQVETGQGSGGVRTALLEEGFGLVGETGGLGVGAGQAEVRVRALDNFPGVGNLHNWWLEVLVNGGIVAFGLYLAFFFGLIRGTFRAARRGSDPFVRYFGLASLLGLTAWAFGSLGPSTAIHYAPMWITFGLAMGAVVLLAQEARR